MEESIRIKGEMELCVYADAGQTPLAAGVSLGCPGLSADCAALNLLSQAVGNACSALHSP